MRKEVPGHLGVRPVDELDVDLLKEGRLERRPGRETSAAAVFGILARPGTLRLSIEDLGGSHRLGLGRRNVKITADTNVLLRTVVQDDDEQAADCLLKHSNEYRRLCVRRSRRGERDCFVDKRAKRAVAG